ncbi:hypothetical protein [Cloacibacterium normanense]|uniref:hypothetical protein n=1 Tax=Cloacibacterium normanense TaxID=237258 RepID=UPI00352D6470
MNKLEKLNKKSLTKEKLVFFKGALAALELVADNTGVTITDTKCTHSNNTPAWDCGDSYEDKDK